MSVPDNFVAGAAVGALFMLILSLIAVTLGSPIDLDGQRKSCTIRAKSIDCVQVWAPIGEAKQ